jgi:hypothetical protein
VRGVGIAEGAGHQVTELFFTADFATIARHRAKHTVER